MIKIPIYIITALSIPHSAYANRLLATAKGLLENGREITVVFLYASQEVKACFIQANIPFIVLSTFRNNYINCFVSLVKLIKYIRHKSIIILYLTTPILIHWLFLFASSKSKIFHERTEYPDAIISNKKLKKIDLSYYHWLCKKFHGILTISEAIKEYFIQHGVESEKIYVFPMLIQPQRFENCLKSNDKEKEEYIAYCGDMGGNKDGLWDLIDAYYVFLQKINTVKLYLIGDTKDNGQYIALQNKVKMMGMENRIVFTGRIRREDMPAYLCNASALVLARPNNYQAQGGFPTKLGEYLATGNPVVITRTGEIDHYLKDRKDCYFVEPGNPQAFAEVLIDVFANYNNAMNIGLEGQKKIYTDFNYYIQTKKMLNFILEKL